MSLTLDRLTSIVATVSKVPAEYSTTYTKVSRYRGEQTQTVGTATVSSTSEFTIVPAASADSTRHLVRLMSLSNTGTEALLLTVSSKKDGVKTTLDSVTLPAASTWHFDQDEGYYVTPEAVASTTSMDAQEDLLRMILLQLEKTNNYLSIITGRIE